MAKVSRLEKKLETCFGEKEYYEAHQIYRTLFYRLSSSGKYDELLPLLENGCLRLIEVNELGSAYDLAETFAETLLKSAVPVTPERLDSIEKDERVKFISTCVKWSQSVATRPTDSARGNGALHGRFASVLWKENSMEMARSHFLLSDTPQEMGAFLADWQSRDEVEAEPELWLTLAILQLVCLRRVLFARRVLRSFVSQCASIHRCSPSPPFPLKLLNFSWLLLHVVPTRNLSHFTSLVARYRPEMEQDATLLAHLDHIGQLYFGVAPRPQGGGMLGSLIKGLMGNQDEKKEVASSDTEDELSQDASGEKAVVEAELARLVKEDHPEMEHHDDDLD